MTTNMKFKRFVAVAACVLWCGSAFAQTQSMDKELSALAEKLAAQVKESGRKKVTILDFTDLQGNSSELGRFLTEEISVALVEHKSGFAVMDRANLKTILAEHKLTADGLVEPENAKKLGQFSGVDAIILGKVTLLKDEVNITAKIIATDTAETVGAARGRVPMGKEIEHLLASARTSSASTHTNPPQPPSPPKNTISEDAKEIAGLSIKVESLKAGENRYSLLATFIFQNTSTNTLGCALLADQELFANVITKIVDKEGREFTLPYDNLAGIACFREKVQLTQIDPNGAINVTAKYRVPYPHQISAPLRVQLVVCIVAQKDGEFPEERLRRYNFLIDVTKLR